MRLALAGIFDRGIPNRERVQLNVLADANLSYYVILDTTYINPQGISNLLRHAFWFPPQGAKAGEQVILYTGPGLHMSQRNLFGVTVHYFYWGLKNTIWNKSGDCAVLMELNSWATSPYG